MEPLQQPYPPIYVPSISRASKGLQAAAARNFRFISHHMIHTDVLVDQWKTYSVGAASAGRIPQPEDWSISRHIFVAETTKEAKQFARNSSLGKCIQYILDLTARCAPDGVGMWKPHPEMPDFDCNLDYFMDQVVIAGDPEYVTSELLALRERVGPFGKLVHVAHCWDDREKWIRNLELFASEVLPAYNRALN